MYTEKLEFNKSDFLVVRTMESEIEGAVRISLMLDSFGAHLVAFLLCINDELEYFNEDIPQLLAGSLAHDDDERKRKDNLLDLDFIPRFNLAVSQ